MTNDFDIASQQYYTVFTYSNIGKAQRSMVYAFMNPIVKQAKKLTILELNCGTGEDAIYFSKFGSRAGRFWVFVPFLFPNKGGYAPGAKSSSFLACWD